MSAGHARLPGFRTNLSLAARRFYAWWEGYAFDEEAERAALMAHLPLSGGASGRPDEDIVAESIWGAGRLSPGAPVWTMRYARMLDLPVKADVVVFGADAGGPLEDLAHGTRWRTTGLTHAAGVAGGRLRNYATALDRIQKARAIGGLSFFELSRDATPLAFAEFAADMLAPGAKAAFVDWAVVRKGARLPKCFPQGCPGSPKTESEYRDALRSAGFVIEEAGDDTAAFTPLITEGWAGWRRAYKAIATLDDARRRAGMMRALNNHAHVWAERFEALRSGQLRVMFMKAARR